jgi:predicted nucleotidyltransferase
MAGVDRAESRAHSLCEHCGTRLVIELPVEVSVWAAANFAFAKAHANCPKRQ